MHLPYRVVVNAGRRSADTHADFGLSSPPRGVDRSGNMSELHAAGPLQTCERRPG